MRESRWGKLFPHATGSDGIGICIAEISGASNTSGERELVPFVMDDSVDLLTTQLDIGGGSWDQFKVNKDRFGVESG